MKTIYDFSVKDADLNDISLGDYQEKTILIVNVASYCGLTYQYKGLENLYKKYKNDGLEILGFPCNQFAMQEPGSNEEIKDFCDTNYGVTFKIFNKIKSNFPQFISEVRGRGLFLGIDLIKSTNNNPNERLAKLIINKMRQRGILLSIDGPYHNVIKIKPPMTFDRKNVDFVCFELNNVFTNL